MRKKQISGQAAIEFITIIIVVFFFLFFYLSLAISLIASEYMEYATFMAARTYKSGYSSEEFQKRNAESVFRAYADRIDGVIHNPNIEFIVEDPANQQRAGVRSTYEVDLFYLPPIFLGNAVPNGRITLESEGRLGRDPANDECVGYFDQLVQRLGLGISGGFVSQMEDNGC